MLNTLPLFQADQKETGPRSRKNVSLQPASKRQCWGGLKDLWGMNVTAPAAGLPQHTLEINFVSDL